MNNHRHEQIQRYLSGQASAAETAALQAALSEDAELRALYLDYMNLDVALGAAAEAAAVSENEIGGRAAFPRSPARSLPRPRYWLGAAAVACAVLATIVMLPGHRTPSPAHPDVAAACDSAKEAIARLSVEPPSSFPAWASPTAPILDQPQIAKWDP
jgi:anti-sigma factor RsiW